MVNVHLTGRVPIVYLGRLPVGKCSQRRVNNIQSCTLHLHLHLHNKYSFNATTLFLHFYKVVHGHLVSSLKRYQCFRPFIVTAQTDSQAHIAASATFHTALTVAYFITPFFQISVFLLLDFLCKITQGFFSSPLFPVQ